jgi:cobyrinic acid a,c-diamide synthase
MHQRLRSLGYREITLLSSSVIGSAGLRSRGHEFHYSGIDDGGEQGGLKTVFSVSARAGMRQDKTGYVVNRTLGSYIHLHFGSQPEAAEWFVKNCLTYRHERTAIS